MDDTYRFGADELTVTVNAHGAELCSLAYAQHGEMLWPALPIWPQHAPNLFPIVGQLVGDALHVNGTTYHLTRHGFARRRVFRWVDRSAESCRLLLTDDDETRALYPFAFGLELGYSVVGDTLTISYTVNNPGDDMLPASVGAHPAFRWPLAAGIPKEAHTLVFSTAEPAPIRRLQDGLLKLDPFPSPIVDRTLDLRDALFVDDAIIMDQLASQAVRFSAPGAPSIDVSWDGFRELGLWTKPGADFLCIEPWYGYASPLDFDGPFAAKPGLLLIEPGATRTLTMRIRVHS
jgi:galactose mutarotase-like enzyme